MLRAPPELFVACSVIARTENLRLGMSDTYIIEVTSQAAGIVVRSRGGYVFFSATERFNSMEGQLFRSAREAERAARRLAGNGETSPRHIPVIQGSMQG
jgi:hypothetical protein